MRRLLSSLSFITVLLVILTATSVLMAWQKDASAKWVNHTLQVLYVQSDMQSACQDLDSYSANFALSNDPAFKTIYKNALIEIDSLTSDSSAQQKRLNDFKSELTELKLRTNAVWENASKALKPGQMAISIAKQHRAMSNVRRKLNEFMIEEERLLEQRRARASMNEAFFWTLSALLIVALISMIFLMRRALLEYRRETEGSLAEVARARDAAIIAQKVAEDALESRTKFLSTVSHEVRTPMSGVIGLVELIKLSTENNAEIHNLAEIALESCQRLLQMLNDLLDASKLQAGALKLEYRLFAVKPVLNDLLRLSLSEAAKKKNRIALTIAPDVPDLLYGDELRLRQILQNLIFNAIKFTDDGEISISAELLRMDADVSTVKFSVSDTGIGIEEEQQRRIFQPFAQAEESTARRYGGTGLGLSISRTLAELMGGQIGLSSAPGRGSTFWVSIPFRGGLCKAA